MNNTAGFTPPQLTLIMLDAPARRSKSSLWIVSIALIISLLVPALLFTGLGPRLSAAVPWNTPGDASFAALEPYVTDTYVLKDGSTYKMWYTHGPSTQTLVNLASQLTSVLTPEIISDISSKDLNALLNHLAALDVNAVYNLLNAFSTSIGYATSTDGISWTMASREVVTGTGLGAFDSVGSPYVIKDGSTYKMWYTASKTALAKPALQAILTGFGGNAAQRKQAITDLMGAAATAIYYSTSSNGTTWSAGTQVLAGSSGLWDSASAPSVIKESDSSYKMWYTHGQTTLTGADLDRILADLATFGVDDLLDEILAKTGTSIGYATSTDGTTWGSPTNVLAGASGAWDSLSSPCVLAKGSGYEMWYSRMQTNLDSTGRHTFIDDVLALSTNIGNLLTTLKNGLYDQFLTDLQTLIDNGMVAVKADLAATSIVITYAASTDGIIWETQNSELFVGSALWNSLMSPSVMNDSGVYKIWYVKGMAVLGAQNMVDLLQGTTPDIGYATGFNLVAETASILIKDTDNIVVVQLNINRGKNSSGGSTQTIPGGIDSYQALLTWDPAGMEIIGVRGGSTPFNNTPTLLAGVLSATGTSPLNPPNNSPVAKVIVRLNGNATTSYTLTITYQRIMSAGKLYMNVPAESSQTLTFLRGDANGNGVVNVVDAMFTLQCASGNRLLSEVNAVNAASVRYDGASGDIITIVDAMFLLQFASGNRNANFQ